MTTASKSTVRYVAKQGYQLFLMTGRTTGTIAGLHYLVMPRDVPVYGPRVRVYIPGQRPALQTHVDMPIAKSWANL